MNKYDIAMSRARDSGEVVRGDNYIVLPETVTTMADADAAIKRGAGHGYNVIALRQTGGVGTTDAQTGKPRQWASLEGNLLLSRVVDIHRAKGEHERHIDWIGSLAAGETAASYVRDPKIKLVWHWPNDLWQEKPDGGFAKFGGVLVPLSLKPDNTDKVVLGVGVNIAQAPSPDAMRPGSTANSFTSLNECGAKGVTVGGFLEQFEQRFERHLADFRLAQSFAPILEKIGYSKPGTDGLMTLQFKEAKREVSGRFAGFETAANEAGVPTGYLRLQGSDGSVQRYSTWELFMTSPMPRLG